eukprot:1917803-Pyramimonas_sp.AAC.1
MAVWVTDGVGGRSKSSARHKPCPTSPRVERVPELRAPPVIELLAPRGLQFAHIPLASKRVP